VELAFRHAGLDWQQHVETDPSLLRPAEIDLLCGDASRAARVLGWKPTVDFAGLVGMMVDADLERVRCDAASPAG
jgi:GDPmannose 4,6-dehydratase